MVTIFHNPRCSKSRETLQLLQNRGIEPEIVLYLESPPDKTTLVDLLKKLDMDPRALLRKGEAAYKENNLRDTGLSDDEIIECMLTHPKLIERPIVVNGSRAALGRPPEAVLDIL